MDDNFSSSQHVTKYVRRSNGGIVAAQHARAARAGAKILAAGGNAVDAAIATSFAIGVVEPWMSGPGGGGAMIVRMASQGSAKVINFGMRAPSGLNISDFPLTGGVSDDLFPWARVADDRNLHGPLSIAVPGLVDGMGLAHQHFASKPWAELLAPAIKLAGDGPIVDWYASLLIASNAPDLDRYELSRRTFLRDGYPLISHWTAAGDQRIDFSLFARTLQRVAEKGPREFYDGALAREIAADVQALGGCLSASDLAGYRAVLLDPLQERHRGTLFNLLPGLTAGPTFRRALDLLGDGFARGGDGPSADDFVAYARALQHAYGERLAAMGDVEGPAAQVSTTHFNVVDRHGNMVAVTQTLLSAFGSKVMLPGSGMLMNNGIMWFDPEQGRPNSLGPGKRCLMNICPVIAEKDSSLFALGASGGRKILPAVLQLATFMSAFGMDLETAFRHGRIDVSGGDLVVADQVLPQNVRDALAAQFSFNPARRMPFPYFFACPSGVARKDGENFGMTEIMSPWGDAVSEDGV